MQQLPQVIPLRAKQTRKRRKSIDEFGDAHELTFSCYRRLPLLRPARTKKMFLSCLDAARRQYDFDVWAYVLMPEHVHLIVWPRTESCKMRSVLRAVKQGFAQWLIADLQRRRSPLLSQLKVAHSHRVWQRGGGYDRNLYSAKVIWAAIEYMHQNPVRRKLVSEATDWPFSSARYYEQVGDIMFQVDQCDVWR